MQNFFHKPISFLKYIGGKHKLLPFIFRHFPHKHKVFVDVFGGSGAVILNKKPSKIEVFNDIDENIYNLFKVAQDEEKTKRLMRMLEFSLYSRKGFNESKQRLIENQYTDDVLKAYDYFVVLRQGFKPGRMIDNFFSFSIVKNYNSPYFNTISKLKKIHDRLKNVIIECLDFREIVKKYSSSDTFFYLDPPYLIDGEENDYYGNKFTIKDHEELVDLIIKYSDETKSKFLLSGYNNGIYEKLLFNGFKMSSMTKTIRCRVIKKGQKEQRRKVTECLWYNYTPFSEVNKNLSFFF